MLSYRIQVETAAATEPVSKAQAANWLRADPDLEELRIDESRVAARDFIERISGQRFGAQTLKIWLPGFPSCGWRFPVAPVLSVTGMNYYTAADVQVAVPLSLFYHVADSEPPYLSRIVLKDGNSWPTATLRPVDAVEIIITAGHAEPPPMLAIALRQLTAHYFSNPSATIAVDRAQASAVEIPHGAMAILNSYRLYAD